MASDLTLGPDRETAVRLALLQERLGGLIESSKGWEARAESWRTEMSSSVGSLGRELAELRAGHRALKEKLDDVEGEVVELRKQMSAKVGVVYFYGLWRVVLGSAVLITATGGMLTIGRALHLLP